MSRCPNINSPEWKALEAQHGTDKALELYAKNGYEIPNVIRQDLNPTLVDGKYLMNSTAARQMMEQNPKLARKVFEHMKKNYPTMRLNIDGLFDIDGNWVPMTPGTKGMHVRNALTSAIAFSNSADIETVPHEFAHEYIQMFWDSPVVRNAIEQHSEEELADEMGKFFVNKATKSWFQDFIDDLFYAVRKLFGMPGVSEILARDYYKHKNQGIKSSGRGYVSYQKESGLDALFKNNKKRKTGSGFNTNIIKNTDTSQFIVTDEKVHKVYNDLIMPVYMSGGQLNLDQFEIHIRENIDKIIKSKLGARKQNRQDKMEWNHASIDNDMILNLQAFLKTEHGTRKDVELTNLARYLMGDTDLQLTPDEQVHYDTLFKMHQAVGIWFQNYGHDATPVVQGYQVAIANMLLTEPGKVVPKESVSAVVSREFEEQKREGNKLLKKLKKKSPDKVAQAMDKIGDRADKMQTWLFDGFLLQKSLTGKNTSMFGDLFYTSLDHGVNEYAELQNDITKFKSDLNSVEGFNRWGVSDIRKRNISEYETYPIETQKGGEMQLTMSEAATLYLNLKQADTYKSVVDNGFYLNDIIKGRPFKSGDVHKISNRAATQLVEDFENDPEKKMFIDAVRNSMDAIYDKVNPTFRELNGYNLKKLPNFFPAYYGQSTRDVRKEKRHIEQFKSQHARMGGDMPIRVGDAKSLLSSYSVSAGMYAAYSRQIRNNRMIADSIRSEFSDDPRISHRLEMVDGFLNKIEDPSLLYPSQGEQEWERKVNELMSNFSVFVLGYNPAVVIKQTASYMLAQEFIDKKYLKEAGTGFGALMIPKLGKFFKALKRTNKNENLDVVRKILPVEYRLDPNENKAYAEILQHSPFLANRSQGHSHRELSETLMSMSDGKGTIAFKIPGMKKTQYISMARAMEGIRVMDTVTIMDIWSATKLMADDQIANGELTVEKDSPEYWEHVSVIAEQAIKRTQPTSDVLHRSWLSSQQGVIPRTVTMFSSATQQQAKIMISRMMDYNNNPTPENLKKLKGTFWRTMFMTSVYITAIDGMKTMITHGFDDEEELMSFAFHSTLNNMAGYFHGIGTFVRQVSSRMDRQPWTAELQHPVEAMLGDLADGSASLLKGDFSRAFKQLLLVGMQSKGVPGYPFKFGWNMVDRISEPTADDKKALKENPSYQSDVKNLNAKYDKLKAGVHDEDKLKEISADKRKEKSDLRDSYL